MTITLKEWELQKRAEFDESYQKNIKSILENLKEKFLKEGFLDKSNNEFWYEAEDSFFKVKVKLECQKGRSLLSWDYLEDENEKIWISEIEDQSDLECFCSTDEIFEEAIDKLKELIIDQIV